MAVKPLKISTNPDVFTPEEVGPTQNIGVGGIDLGDTGNAVIEADPTEGTYVNVTGKGSMVNGVVALESLLTTSMSQKPTYTGDDITQLDFYNSLT